MSRLVRLMSWSASRRPKIAIAASGLGRVSRGVEAWAADLALALHQAGHDVTLFQGAGNPTADWQEVLPCKGCFDPEVRHWVRRLKRFGGWRFGFGSGQQVQETTFTLRLWPRIRRDYDILHVQDFTVAYWMEKLYRLGLLRARVILGHGTEESLDMLAKFTYLQHLAPWHLEEARAAGVWRPTWTAIPNFIDTQLFHPGEADALRSELGIPPDGQVVLTAAAIKRHHKRIDYLLQEFAAFRRKRPDSPAYLVVAGGWEADTDELVQLGRQMLGDRVRFLVRFPRHRMPELYRLASVFVLCSLKEMMPIALLEAGASGLPCLVNRHPVVEWMVGPGGEAVEMAQPGALSHTLERLLTSNGVCRELGRRARQRCVDNFSRDRVVAQIVDYYSFILNRGASSVANGHNGVAPATTRET